MCVAVLLRSTGYLMRNPLRVPFWLHVVSLVFPRVDGVGL